MGRDRPTRVHRTHANMRARASLGATGVLFPLLFVIAAAIALRLMPTLTSPATSGAIPPSLAGRAWTSQVGATQWASGRLGGRTTKLPAGEVPVAAVGRWVLSVPPGKDGKVLAARDVEQATHVDISLPLRPITTEVTGDRAFVSGFGDAGDGDSGLWVVDLVTGMLTPVVPPSGEPHPRTVVASRSGATIVSAVCSSEGSCALDVIVDTSSPSTHLPAIGGYLRTTSDQVAIVGPDPATWIAGIDLATGKELWRRSADEMWSGYVTTDGRLIQASLEYAPNGSIFHIDSIDALTGKVTPLLAERATAQIGLWQDLSSDEFAVVGPGYDVADALLPKKGAAAIARIVGLSDQATTSEVTVGGN